MNRSVGLNGSEGIFRKLRWSIWRIRIVVTLTAAILVAVVRPVIASEPQALLGDGGVRRGRIVGTDAASLTFVAAAAGDPTRTERVPLASIRQIHFTGKPRLIDGVWSPRQFEFRGGERWHAGFESIDAHHVSVLNANDSVTRITRAALTGINQPAGARVVVCDDFENRPALFENSRLSPAQRRSGRLSLEYRAGDDAVSCKVPGSIGNGRIELSLFDTGEVAERDWMIEFEFGAPGRTELFRFIPGWSRSDYRCSRSGREQGQPLTRSKGWHRFTLFFESQRLTALLDGKVIATSAGVQALTGIRILGFDPVPSNGEPAGAKGPSDAARPKGWIDDLQILENAPRAVAPIHTQPNDLLWLRDGDELFGSITSADGRNVSWIGRFGPQQTAWPEINGLTFAACGDPAAAPVEGVIATIEMAPEIGSAPATSDRIVAALQRVTETELLAAHPCLGTLAIPLGEIARIVPHFRGVLYLVDPAFHHLGNEIREEFNAKLAEGLRLERRFTLEDVPKKGAFVSLLAADVEPLRSPNERFRRQLAAGRLTTGLVINGRRVADLNRFVSWRALPENPERLRIAVPAAILKKGMNTLRLEQHPAEDDAEEFDDCEISRLAIEVDSVTR